MMNETKYGEPLKEDNIDVEPLINAKALESVDNFVKNAVKEGAKFVTGVGMISIDVAFITNPLY